MKKTLKLLSIMLCICMLLALASCAAQEKTLMTFGDKTLSVNTYQLLLSRMKGSLDRYGYDVNNEKFWNTIINTDGMTYDDYFRANVMNQASRYVIADYLFDKNGLTLTDDRLKTVDELMGKLVEKAGSKNKLNAELGNYGANYDILRDLYVLETKIDMLKDHLYGENGEKISNEVREDYLRVNYRAFGQLFIAGYEYLIDTDDFGDYVYYTDKKHTEIAYDKKNGKTRLDEYGKEEKDVLGDPVYYGEDGKIAYDKKNGILGYSYDENGEKKVKVYNDEKLSQLQEKAKEYEKQANGNIDAFYDLAKLHGEGEDDGEIMYLYYSVGYYASQNDAYKYLDDIAEQLDKMDVGECKTVKSSFGYHVICKYDVEEGVYDSEEQKSVFSDFYDGLIAYLFEEECKKYESRVKVNTSVADEASDMNSIGSNTGY